MSQVAQDLTFSVRLPSGVGLDEFRTAARTAEAAGFDQIWTGNDLFKRSGIVPVTLALADTTRLRVGSSVLNPVTLHPAEIATLVANLQELSAGRYVLGLGAGSEVDLRWAGLEPDAPVTRTRRGLRLVRSLLAGQSPSSLPTGEGAGWHEQGRLDSGPVAPTPIYLGAMGPKMLALAGREADGVLALCLPPGHFRWVADQVACGGASGRPFDLACCVWLSIDDDADAARARLAPKIAAYAGALAPDALAAAGYDPDQFARVHALMAAGDLPAAVDAVDHHMLELGVVGDPGAVVERCAALIEAGVRHLSFGQPLGRSSIEAIECLGTSVLPILKGQFR